MPKSSTTSTNSRKTPRAASDKLGQQPGPGDRSRRVIEYTSTVAESQTHPLWRAAALVALVTTVSMGVGGTVVVGTVTLPSDFRGPFLASVGVLSVLVGLVMLFSLSVVSEHRTVYW